MECAVKIKSRFKSTWAILKINIGLKFIQHKSLCCFSSKYYIILNYQRWCHPPLEAYIYSNKTKLLLWTCLKSHDFLFLWHWISILFMICLMLDKIMISFYKLSSMLFRSGWIVTVYSHTTNVYITYRKYLNHQ